MAKDFIRIGGAREHNLKNLSLSIPRDKLVVITGLSGSGKGTVLKGLEDLGYYSVDNLPIELMEKFAELTQSSRLFRSKACYDGSVRSAR